MVEKLEKLGFSRIEAKVYIALVELGPSFAGAIVAKTKQHRQQVYDALEKLEAKQLVSVSQKSGKKLFHPANPERLYNLVREQEMVLKEVVPVLKNKFQVPPEEVVLYHGADGFSTALQNRITVAKRGKFIQVIGYTGKELHEITKEFFEPYLNGLRKKGSGIQWIIYESQLDEFKRYFGKYLKQNTRAWVLAGSQRTPIATTVLPDRVQISLFHPNPTVIEIRNQSLADEYQKYFSLLKKQSKQIKE